MTAPMKARKKPVTVEVMRLTDENVPALIAWFDEHNVEEADAYFLHNGIDENGKRCKYEARIATLEGEMTARSGDWIIRGVQGEFYPCKPDIFAKTYDLEEN